MTFNKPYQLGILIFCLLAQQVFSQTYKIDSLQKELQKNQPDSVFTFIYLALAEAIYTYDSLKSDQYREKGYALAKKINNNLALGSYYNGKGMSKQFTSDDGLANLIFDTAIYFFNKTIEEKRFPSEVAKAKLSIAVSLGQKAHSLAKIGKSDDAIKIYFQTIDAWKASEEPDKNEAIAVYYTFISTIYSNLKEYRKTLEYDKLSLMILLNESNEESIAFTYLYVCQDFLKLNELDSRLVYLLKAKPIVMQLNNHNINYEYYERWASYNSIKKDYQPAIGFYTKALNEAFSGNYKFRVMEMQKEIGYCYLQMGNYNIAKKYLFSAIPFALESKHPERLMKIYEDLSVAEEKTNHPAKALHYLQQVLKLRDSINLEGSKKSVAEIENKYQATEKQKEILQLHKNKKIQTLSLSQKTTYNYILISSLAGLMLLSFIGYRNLRHRQQISRQQNLIHQQRISELEKDKQLIAVDSILKGQEVERSRMAKDLHDGLGGLLSGVKFSLSNMKDNLIITPDNMAVFERSLDLIDTSIKELRRVAQNMTPEMLKKFGLDEALKDYCNTINATKLLELKYQSIGMETRIESSSEIIIYRIIQELLNNIMKHAGASEARVQLIKDENRFNIIVEDNGKGFDTTLMKANTGAGLTNVQSRVDYLKGQLEIHSEMGKGTLINIEFNI
ncbi:sensor histidine kinase [Ferruginibacter sp.]|uniref:ATP-binding protein n=1 Tax=Ferruginibacter sp. TaxID=1940288 RepID=UPI0019BC02A1|nr:sensor histidine kinase [Ferruginibacter sp.]MBC7629288.1 sensor histidine kinase [Ferruginibacter sp.]